MTASIEAELLKVEVGEVKTKAKALITELRNAKALVAAKEQALQDLYEAHPNVFSDVE
jgi:FtsZ-binding cell division protein ZapB